jgi:hypothetical protein
MSSGASSPVNPNFFSLPENGENRGGKIWTQEEILKMWPQAEGELRGFQRALAARSPLSAAQLGMALQLAHNAFEQIKTGQVPVRNLGGMNSCPNCNEPGYDGDTCRVCGSGPRIG